MIIHYHASRTSRAQSSDDVHPAFMNSVAGENDWDHMMEINMMEESIEKVTGEEMVIAVRAVKPGKASGPFGVCAEIVSASGEVGISVIMELCQRMLDEWHASVLVPIFEGKGDVRNCNACRAVKLLQHALEIIERVLERRMVI